MVLNWSSGVQGGLGVSLSFPGPEAACLAVGEFMEFRDLGYPGTQEPVIISSGHRTYPFFIKWTGMEVSAVAKGLGTHEGPPHPHQEVGCSLPPVPHRSRPWLWFG